MCRPTVTSLRWVIPAVDGSVPRDTSRLAVAVEIVGSASAVPVVASGAGQAGVVAVRGDGGLATGALTFGALGPGALRLVAGWPGGPQAQTSVRVGTTDAIVLSPVPSHGTNTTDFQPNDPGGFAWRRDDLVPLTGWPDLQLRARRAAPDASIALLDAGTFDDGGQFLSLSDVEFDAFRDWVEVSAVTATWESAPQRVPVTRWRWRRVVALPTTTKLQQPIVRHFGGIVVGTQESPTSGRLIELDGEGVPVAGPYSSWDAAVTTPFLSVEAVGGVDADGGFIFYRDECFRVGAPVVAIGSVEEDWIRFVAANGQVYRLERGMLSEFRQCTFDAGLPTRILTGFSKGVVVSAAGEVCDVETSTVRSVRVRPASVIGPSDELLMSSIGGDLIHGATTVDAGPRNLDFMVSEPRAKQPPSPPPSLYGATASALEVWPFDYGVGFSQFQFEPRSAWFPLSAPLATSPVLRVGDNGRRWLLTVDVAGTLASFDAASLRQQWSWRPDAGLRLQAPLGFATSRTHDGTLLMVVDGAVIAVIADGTPQSLWAQQYSWLMESGSSCGCHEYGEDNPLP